MKAASTCHHVTSDYYGIAASFEVSTKGGLRNDLWYIVVDGLSTWPTYGQLVAATRIDYTFGEIRSVDCAASGGNNVYLTWDRFIDYGYHYFEKARLTRVSVDVSGTPTWLPPVEVGQTTDCAAATFDETVYAPTPRVAYASTGQVLVAYVGRLADATNANCNLCVEAFRTSDFAFLGHDSFWGDLTRYPAYDVEWNGDSRFMVFYQEIVSDHAYGSFNTALVDQSGHVSGSPVALESSMPIPQDLRLIYSDNSQNLYSSLLGFSSRNTYWIRQNGTKAGVYLGSSSRASFAACEYWGPSQNVGHTYTWFFAPLHQHWRGTPSAPQDQYFVSGYRPLACSSCDDDFDEELILVTRTDTDPSHAYWSLEPED